MVCPEPDAVEVAGRYVLLEEVARGAMGAVHRALDQDTGDTVAFKRLLALHDEGRKRFLREVSVLRGVAHPGIVRYLDHGSDAEGVPFLVMEWLAGETLEERLEGGPLSVADAVAVGRRLGDALGAIHARGIVHRDLKPANLVLTGDDPSSVKLLDFGVAHVAAVSLGVTKTGTLIGTPEFMSPEQSRGELLSPSSDVFSLGAVLYECLAGISPFASSQVVATLAKILFSQPEPIRDRRPEVPAALAELLHAMLAKAPEGRPPDGAAVARAFETLSLEAPADAASVRPRAVPPSDRPGLTREEEAIVTVVLAAPPEARPEITGAETRRETVSDGHRWLEQLTRRTTNLGIELHALARGGVIATVERGVGPVEQVAAAARCALQIRDVAPDVTVVVATGRANVADIIPAGRVLDAASAMFEGAPGGRILLDDRTAGLLDSRFEVGADDGGLFLVRERERGDSIRRFMGRETPLVGRRRELRALEMTYAQAVEESSARAVLVTSEVGVGKSRLRYELLRRIAASEEPPMILTAWGDPIRRDSPLAMIASALRRGLGVLEGEAPRLARARLRERAARVFSAPAQVEHLPFLAELMGVAQEGDPSPALLAARRDPQLMSDRLRGAFLAFVEAACAQRPLALVLDDLHWADAPSVDLVSELLRAAEELPVFVLALGRPEAVARFGPELSRGAVDRMALRELSSKASRRLITSVLGEQADEETVERIIALTDGNAFFLEELIRGVAEGESDLPDSVAAMVQARLTATSPEARRALRAASVFGEVAWSSGVAKLMGHKDVASCEGELDELVRAELLAPRTPSRFPTEVEHVFRHALVQQTAYAMLSDEDRALGHRLAGDWLEMAGERDPMSLAAHFDLGGEHERAAEQLLQAARAALGAHDIESAARRVTRALELSEQDALRGALHGVAAELERWRGHHDSASEHAEHALEALAPGTPAWVRAASEAIAAAARLGDYDRAEAQALAVEEVCPADDAAASEQVAALALATRQLFHAGRYASAERRLEAAERIAGPVELDPAAEAELHRVRAARARQLGDPQGDADGYAAAVKAYERAGDARRGCNTRVSLGFALAELGELEAAERHLSRALADAERMGLEPIAARAHHNLGMVYAEQGRLADARVIEERAVEASEAAGDLRLEGGSRVYLSTIAFMAGDHAEAEAQADRAATCFAAMPPARAGALGARARARVALGRPEEAARDAAEALALLESLGSVEEYEALIVTAALEARGASGAELSELAARASARLSARAAHIPEVAGRRRFVACDSANARLAALCADAGFPVEVE